MRVRDIFLLSVLVLCLNLSGCRRLRHLQMQTTSEANEIKQLGIEGTGFTCTNGVKMIWIAPSRDQISMPHGYWIAETETTENQWRIIMSEREHNYYSPKRPIVRVDWFDAMTFCARLTKREYALGQLKPGYRFSLPTVLQWEYACDGAQVAAGELGLRRIAWFNENAAHNEPQEVGLKHANRFGLYDMLGNVWEWCSGSTDQRSSDTVASSDRPMKGGSYNSPASLTTCGQLRNETAYGLSDDIGFRIVLIKE